MSERTLRDFTPAERNAYVVWQQKLADHTLSKEQHDHAKQEIDKLFRRGPWGMIELLRDELREFKSRLTSLEDFVLAGDARVQKGILRGEEIVKGRLTGEISSPQNVIRADCGNSMSLADKAEAETLPQEEADPTEPNKDVEPSERQVGKPAKDARGRKALRFRPEKDANRKWHILDRESGGGMWTDHGPYKTRREAKEMCDTLNNMPSPPPLRFVPEDSVDAVIAGREAEASVALDKDPDCGTRCVEELPDGTPVGNSITGPYTAENQEPPEEDPLGLGF